MNLKEAFRFQKKLLALFTQARAILLVDDNVTRVETTYLHKKVIPEAENEVVVKDTPIVYAAGKINEIIDFALYLLDQRAVLGRAIHLAKAGLELGMDLETGLNGLRQALADDCRRLSDLRASEKLVPNGGTGYRFNAEGNQVTYRCDTKVVTTIDFDRNKVRKMAAQLSEQADDVSTRLDVAQVTTQVDYQPPFNVNDSFESVFEQFCETRGKR